MRAPTTWPRCGRWCSAGWPMPRMAFNPRGNPHALAEGLPRVRRGELVRGAVLPAAPVRLPLADPGRAYAAWAWTGHGGRRPAGQCALQGHGAQAVRHDDLRRGHRARLRGRDAGRVVGLSTHALAAAEAGAGVPADRLPRRVPRAAAAVRGRPQYALRALVPAVQRSAGGAAHRYRHPGGGQALLTRAARCTARYP